MKPGGAGVWSGAPFGWILGTGVSLKCADGSFGKAIVCRNGLGYAGMKGRAVSGVGHEKCVTCVTLRAFSGIFFLVQFSRKTFRKMRYM